MLTQWTVLERFAQHVGSYALRLRKCRGSAFCCAGQGGLSSDQMCDPQGFAKNDRFTSEVLKYEHRSHGCGV
jgi:hypothetical protein